MPRLMNRTIRLALTDPTLRGPLIACMCDMEPGATAEIESGLLSKFEEGEDVDVPEYLREHGNPDAAAAWEKHHEENKDLLKKHTAALEKMAGYTHYWRFLPRAAGVHLDERVLDSYLTKSKQAHQWTKGMIEEAQEVQQNVDRGGNLSSSTYSIDSLAYKVFGSFRQDDFIRWLERVTDFLVTAADELARNGDKTTAKNALSMAKGLEKAATAFVRFEAVWSNNWSKYKGNKGAAARAFVNYATLAEGTFDKLARLITQIQTVAGGTELTVKDYGFTDDEWQKVAAAARKIIAAAESQGIAIRGGEGTGSPQITPEHISLNGDAAAGLDHETFFLGKHPYSTSHLSEFCKTARDPYDAVVVSILAVAKKIAPLALHISSDGGPGAIKKVLGHTSTAPRTAAHTLPVDTLVQQTAEMLGLPNWKAAKATPEAKQAADKWVKAVSKALGVWTQKFPPDLGFTTADLMADRGGKAPYNVYMTLANSKGISIADGRWKLYYPENITKLEHFLDSALNREFRSLKAALIDAAEATGA